MVGVNRPMKAPSIQIQKPCLGKIVKIIKNYFFRTKLLHAYVQFVYIVAAKYQIAPSKAEVEVDWPIKALSMSKQVIQVKNCRSDNCHFVKKIF